jgi:hypothetical protein
LWRFSMPPPGCVTWTVDQHPGSARLTWSPGLWFLRMRELRPSNVVYRHLWPWIPGAESDPHVCHGRKSRGLFWLSSTHKSCVHYPRLSFFFFLMALVFELRALCLLGRHSYCWRYSVSPFLWWVFWDRVLQTICSGLALNLDPPDLCLLSC